ncbi:MAG: type II toxin-antitoxin system RelE/ParE family toxin [Hasllibacter sp.]
MGVRSTRGRLIESVLEGRARKGLPAGVLDRAVDLLSAMDAAVALDDLRFPPGNRLEKLSGDREGQHSLRINRQWRFCFRWTPEGPAEVEMVDYH